MCAGCGDCAADAEPGVTVRHELHVTVEPDYQLIGTDSDFADLCRAEGLSGVAMTILSGVPSSEWMTRSSFYGTEAAARLELARVGDIMYSHGLVPIRVKIETVPWHPTAPQSTSGVSRPGAYFESHIGCWLHDHEVTGVVSRLRPLRVYVSRNDLHKPRTSDGRMRFSVTVRSATASRYEQDATAAMVRDSLEAAGVSVDSKFRTEFTWLDLAEDPDMPGGPGSLVPQSQVYNRLVGLG